jgi:hypothetical protein
VNGPPPLTPHGIGWALVVIALGWGLTVLLWQAGG